MDILLEDLSQTQRFGMILGKHADAGDVILLVGELGSGKTALCRGFLTEFTGDPDMDVPSPSYLISLQYASKLDSATTAYHIDPYRLSVGNVSCLLDFEKAVVNDILLIEWPSRLGEQLTNLLHSKARRVMTITYSGIGPQALGREITVKVGDSTIESLWFAAVLNEWNMDEISQSSVSKIPRLVGVPENNCDVRHDRVIVLPDDTYVLGIESSCDDTAVAIIGSDGTIIVQEIASQGAVHAEWGGVVPKLAQEEHAKAIHRTVDACLAKFQFKLSAIAVTVGPGLALCLLVGIRKAMELSCQYQIPLVRVHHMEAHMLVTRMPRVCVEAPQFPFVTLLVSGGHTMLVLTRGIGDHVILGSTIDDSVGEAFDKTARLLGITSIPGGKDLEEMAKLGNASEWLPVLPKPLSRTKDMVLRRSCDMSFAGLKTAVLMSIGAQKSNEWNRYDLAAAFQKCCADHLAERLKRALQITVEGTDEEPPLAPLVKHVVIAGGVAANSTVKSTVLNVANEFGLTVCAPPPKYCTDNGVMVAWTGIERLKYGLQEPPCKLKDMNQTDKYAEARPRWPLGIRHAQCAGKINDSSGKSFDRKLRDQVKPKNVDIVS